LCCLLLIHSVLQVINECSEAETWLIEKKQQQDALPKHANPVLLAADLKKKAETLDRLAYDLYALLPFRDYLILLRGLSLNLDLQVLQADHDETEASS
jgi:hypothetical protein